MLTRADIDKINTLYEELDLLQSIQTDPLMGRKVSYPPSIADICERKVKAEIDLRIAEIRPHLKDTYNIRERV